MCKTYYQKHTFCQTVVLFGIKWYYFLSQCLGYDRHFDGYYFYCVISGIFCFFKVTILIIS